MRVESALAFGGLLCGVLFLVTGDTFLATAALAASLTVIACRGGLSVPTTVFVVGAIVGNSAWAAGSFAGYATAVAVRRPAFAPIHPSAQRLLRLAAALVLVGGATWLIRGAPRSSVTAWLVPMGVRVALLYLLVRLRSVAGVSNAVIAGLVLAAIVQGGIGIFQHFAHWDTGHVVWIPGNHTATRASGIDADPNYYGLSLAIMAGFAVALFRTRHYRVAILATTLALAGIVFSLARGAFLGLGASLVVAAVLDQWRRSKSRSTSPTPWRTLLMGVAVIAVAVVVAVPTGLVSRFTSIGSSSAPVEARVELWQAAARSIRAQPILGAGPDQARLHIRQYIDVPLKKVEPKKGAPLSVHNTLLDTWVDLGLPGLVLWIALLVAAVRRAVQLRTIADSDDARLLADGAILALTAFVVGSLFVTAALSFPFWLTLGLLARAGER